MNLELPKKSEVNKFIPKSKFFTKTTVNTKTKQLFADSVQKIIWRYKLSKETINILGTKEVEEIQIFEIELKEKDIPKNILSIIDKTIPYPILYIFTYKNFSCFGITVRNTDNPKYYFSDWNEKVLFDFNGNNLEQVYHKMVRVFIKSKNKNNTDFKTLVGLDIKREKLEKEVLILEKKLKNEKQFKRQIEINKELKYKIRELEEVKKEL
jgi:hypothetical protein